jgi:hypothetical protein
MDINETCRINPNMSSDHEYSDEDVDNIFDDEDMEMQDEG